MAKRARKPSITKSGNTTKMRYSSGTVVEIKVVKPYSSRNLGDSGGLDDLSGRRRRRSKRKSSRRRRR